MALGPPTPIVSTTPYPTAKFVDMFHTGPIRPPFWGVGLKVVGAVHV